MQTPKPIMDLNGKPFSRKVKSEHDEMFPYGEDTGTLIVCINRKHRIDVITGFGLKAHYVLPGTALGGRGYEKIIIFTPNFEGDGREMMRFKEWIETQVITKRIMNGTIHYV